MLEIGRGKRKEGCRRSGPAAVKWAGSSRVEKERERVWGEGLERFFFFLSNIFQNLFKLHIVFKI
jgi:hypothetical protein